MDDARDRRVRRAEATGGAVTALLAVASCAGHATKADLPWWAVLAVAVSTAGLVGWTGAHLGRRRGGYDVAAPEPPDVHEGPVCGCGRVDLRDHAVHPREAASGRGAAW
ncbi:hypothetical protein GCM10010256_35910 [Streptomyces coeruleorubidus]|uniref:Uncharacterized protein n=1 Tax=Streptomyces coeruleorubidus TaxID=116188 RepID=A0A5J6IB65_STRC4|nr:hypothetical protein CP976_37525 [Streptomyces coeruleorubidus]GGT74048.1 hypothetical protein GCM10010256_35910 [Streptomyces coeruleorubidus]